MLGGISSNLRGADQKIDVKSNPKSIQLIIYLKMPALRYIIWYHFENIIEAILIEPAAIECELSVFIIANKNGKLCLRHFIPSIEREIEFRCVSIFGYWQLYQITRGRDMFPHLISTHDVEMH